MAAFFSRWFAVFYLIFMFILLPGYVMGLSFIDQENNLGVYIGFLPLVGIFIIILIINTMQRRCPQYLPKILTSWDFLPQWMHSLKPFDR
jgi:sodium-dependent phosphate cotransporter